MTELGYKMARVCLHVEMGSKAHGGAVTRKRLANTRKRAHLCVQNGPQCSQAVKENMGCYVANGAVGTKAVTLQKCKHIPRV